jgi:hypothetical protein
MSRRDHDDDMQDNLLEKGAGGNEEISSGYAITAAFVAAIGALMFGYTLGKIERIRSLSNAYF